MIKKVLVFNLDGWAVGRNERLNIPDNTVQKIKLYSKFHKK